MSPPLDPFGGRRPCEDCREPIPPGEMFALIGEDGEAAVVCVECARCARCRALVDRRYPSEAGSVCAGCLLPAEQRASGLAVNVPEVGP